MKLLAKLNFHRSLFLASLACVCAFGVSRYGLPRHYEDIPTDSLKILRDSYSDLAQLYESTADSVSPEQAQAAATLASEERSRARQALQELLLRRATYNGWLWLVAAGLLGIGGVFARNRALKAAMLAPEEPEDLVPDAEEPAEAVASDEAEPDATDDDSEE